jgi:hypothetical protein
VNLSMCGELKHWNVRVDAPALLNQLHWKPIISEISTMINQTNRMYS